VAEKPLSTSVSGMAPQFTLISGPVVLVRQLVDGILRSAPCRACLPDEQDRLDRGDARRTLSITSVVRNQHRRASRRYSCAVVAQIAVVVSQQLLYPA
jgi:hypothetical protein